MTRRDVPWLALAALLCAAQAVLLLRTAWDKSDTYDEAIYAGAAALQWQYGDLGYHPEAPALSKWGYGLGLHVADARLREAPRVGEQAEGFVLYGRGPERMRINLFAMRCATAAATVLAGLLLWRVGRRWGAGAGALAHTLWCFSPSILASGALATLDGWVTAGAVLALWTTVRAVERPTLARAAAVGAALGIAASAKATALGLVPFAGVAVLWSARRHGAAAAIARGLICAELFFVALWAVYAFSVGPIVPSQSFWPAWWPRSRTFGPVPFPDWWIGLFFHMGHGAAGHDTYLFGVVSEKGWWWFYAAALAFKTTLGAQALAVWRAAVAWVAERRSREWAIDAALLAYPALLLAVMSGGNAQLGVKYILPAFPFAMVVAARGLSLVTRPGVRAFAVVAALAGVGESLAAHPDHLMFFNAWAGGVAGGPRYLIVGDDWGQDQRRLAEWQHQNKVERLYYAQYSGNPAAWGIVFDVPPCTPTVGTYALHAVEVHRPRRLPAGCLDWLTAEPPDFRIGGSIYVYRVDEARLQRLAAIPPDAPRFWRDPRSPPPAPANPTAPALAP